VSRLGDEAAPTCATMRDVAVSDVVRVDGSTLYYVEPTTGLSVVDLADVERPHVVARVPFVGTPVVLYVRDGIAWTVFVDWDGRALRGQATATVVRAIDVRDPAHPRVLGEIARGGLARDAKLVGGVLYLLREDPAGAAVEAFRLRSGALAALDTTLLEGTPGRLAASPAGLAALTNANDEVKVAWIDLPLASPGMQALRGVVTVPGGFASWERADGHLVSADEGQRVKVVTCASRACALAEPATLRVIDFAAPGPPRVTASLRLTEKGGAPVTRFVDEILYLTEPSPTDDDASVLRVVRLGDAAPKLAGKVTLKGTIATLVVRDDPKTAGSTRDAIVALGTTRAPDSARVQITIHEVDVRKPSAPKVRGSVTFGSDWTWSLAADDGRAMSFDPGSRLVAVPFTAWRSDDKRAIAGAQLVDLAGRGATAATIATPGWVDRAVFYGGRVIVIGQDGVSSVDYGRMERTPTGEIR
jgi:hypothetical protein